MDLQRTREDKKMTIIKKFKIRRQLSRKVQNKDFSAEIAYFNRKWQDATKEEKAEVIKIYNKYYCKDGNFLNMITADQAFTDSNFITIKYTWGVVPVTAKKP
jgi:hypothetical protein